MMNQNKAKYTLNEITIIASRPPTEGDYNHENLTFWIMRKANLGGFPYNHRFFYCVRGKDFFQWIELIRTLDFVDTLYPYPCEDCNYLIEKAEAEAPEWIHKYLDEDKFKCDKHTSITKTNND